MTKATETSNATTSDLHAWIAAWPGHHPKTAAQALVALAAILNEPTLVSHQQNHA